MRVPRVHCFRGRENQECPANAKIVRHMYYLRTSEKQKEFGRIWRQNNPERVSAYKANDRSSYFSQAHVKLRGLKRSKKWAEENKEKVLAASERYRKKNKPLYAHHAMKRYALKIQATPAWLTENHWRQIRAIYAESARLTRETGARHEVDHIVPLKGKTVCGLHVPWNLRVIPMEQNRRRPRVWRDGDGDGKN